MYVCVYEWLKWVTLRITTFLLIPLMFFCALLSYFSLKSTWIFDGFFEQFFYGQKTVERKLAMKYFFLISFCTRYLTSRLTSPDYILDHGNFRFIYSSKFFTHIHTFWITFQLLTILLLRVLILWMSGGTYSLKSIANDKVVRNLSCYFLFTLKVFARNLMRGSRRRNIFL